MKKLLLIITVAVFGYWQFGNLTIDTKDMVFKNAFESRQSNIQISHQGRVEKILPDDNVGSRHQRVIIRLKSGQTILIAHNIDLAPRVENLKVGDLLEFYGEYEWNEKGGVIHWTHRDPQNRHPHGWLKHNGKTYQ